MGGSPKLTAVIGAPVMHSLSPLIHSIWAHRAGIDAYYIPVEAGPSYEEFAAVVDGLRTVGFAGANVTIPHKENALRYAETASDEAKRAGAANMLTFGPESAAADNSDIFGFEQAVLSATKPGGSKIKTALVIGAGGAARGVILALQRLDVKTIRIANRTPEKATALAALFDAEVIDFKEINTVIEDAQLIVNTTSLGMAGQPSLEIDITSAPDDAIIADIVYSPLETPLLRKARERGLKAVDGLSMLMHQAVPGFKSWFGEDAVVDEALRDELVRALNRRSET